MKIYSTMLSASMAICGTSMYAAAGVDLTSEAKVGGFDLIINRISIPEKKLFGGGTHNVVHISCTPVNCVGFSRYIDADSDVTDIGITVPVLSDGQVTQLAEHKQLDIDQLNDIDGVIRCSVGKLRYALCRMSADARSVVLLEQEAKTAVFKQKNLALASVPRDIPASVVASLIIEHGGNFTIRCSTSARKNANRKSDPGRYQSTVYPPHLSHLTPTSPHLRFGSAPEFPTVRPSAPCWPH